MPAATLAQSQGPRRWLLVMVSTVGGADGGMLHSTAGLALRLRSGDERDPRGTDGSHS